MRPCIAFFFIFCVFRTESGAQDFTPGYIIMEGSDTVRGFISDGTDLALSRGIRFRTEQGASVTTYFPDDLSGFGFANGRTFNRRVPAHGADSSTVFVKRIVHGKLTVWVWRKEGIGAPDFFVENNHSNRAIHLTKSDLKVDKSGTESTIHHATVFLGYLSFVKSDSVHYYPPPDKKFRYDEKNIVKDAVAYNRDFAAQFPTSRYEEDINFRYAFAFGIPISSGDASGFRASVFKQKELPERSRHLSMIYGISYRYWERRGDTFGTFETSWDRHDHNLSILPVGYEFHSASGIVRLYFAVAFGALFLLDTDADITGDRTRFRAILSGNLGAGLKIKVGSQFATLEVTPSRNQFFFNVGYAF